MDVRTLGDALLYLGALAGALLAIGAVVWAVAVRPLKRWLLVQIQAPQQAQAQALQADVQAVQDELSPNSGSSLRDAIDRTEKRVTELTVRLDEHITHHPHGGVTWKNG